MLSAFGITVSLPDGARERPRNGLCNDWETGEGDVRTTIASLAILYVTPLALAAQSGTLAIVVRRSVDSLPVASATITLDSAAEVYATDSAGAIAIRNVAAGAHRVHVRRIGYAPTTVWGLVSNGRTSHVLVRLEQTATELATVRVAGKAVQLPARYAGIAERAEKNFGTLITADDIAQENPLRTEDLLDQIPGVHTNDRSVTFARCQESGTLRGSGTGGGHIQVYIDGVRATALPSRDLNPVIEALRLVNPRSIALMEVYSGVARMPAEYIDDACAVIAIWTKAY